MIKENLRKNFSLIRILLNYLVKNPYYEEFFLALSLLMVYFLQNRMHYIPDAPNYAFRYPENNPKFYRNPVEHNMIYDGVRIITENKMTLHGWLIKKKNSL